MATGVLGLAPQDNQVATYQATQAKAEKPTAVGYDPSKFTVTAPQTVKQQVADVIGENSPLLQSAVRRAELKSTQGMLQRGLLNTSMNIGAGVEAGENALYDKALPIATADASTYKEAATNTTNADNAAKYAKMQADNAAAMRAAELGTNVNLANADAQTKADATTAGAANQFKQTGLETARAITLADKDTDRALQLADKEYQRAMGTAQLDAQTRLALAEMDHATRMELAQVDRNTRVELSTIENNYRQLLQTNQDLATMYNQVSTNISNISASNLSQEAKDTAIRTQLNLLQEGLRAKQAVVGTQATTGTSPSGPTAPNVAALNLGSYFSGAIAKPTLDQAAYDAALAQWNQAQAAHQAKYGVPIPTSAYKDGYKPPSKADFYLDPGQSPTTPTGTSGTTTPTTTTPSQPAPVTTRPPAPGASTGSTQSTVPAGYYRDSRGNLWPR